MSDSALALEQKQIPANRIDSGWQWQRAAVKPFAEPEAATDKDTGHGSRANLNEHWLDFSRVNPQATACPSMPMRCPFGGACHTCPARVQARLVVNQPGDEYEQEADRVAEMVMRMPAPEKKDEEKCQKSGCVQTVQRKAIDAKAPKDVPLIVEEVLSSPGQPLESAIAAYMDMKFSQVDLCFPIDGTKTSTLPSRMIPTRSTDQLMLNADDTADGITSIWKAGMDHRRAHRTEFDFSKVTVHTDFRASESANAIGAQAYTVGSHIVFGRSMYAPHSVAGQKLLAHELTHTIQQSSHGITLNRKDGQTPACPDSTAADFCQPFGSRAIARRCREYLLKSFIPLDESVFGAEVAGLWRYYLSRRHGESLRRRVFSAQSSQIVQGFVNSVTTAERQRQLVDRIKSALPLNCPSLAPGTPTDFPVNRFLSAEDLAYPINYNQPFEIPGHIAGGVGSSDAGPDSRQVSGSVILRRDTDSAGRTTGVHLTTGLRFVVLDAIDFCPGDPGTGQEQAITVPLSRLEMTGLFLQDEPFAYDVPFEVRFQGPPLDEEIELGIVRRCFSDTIPPAPEVPIPAPLTPSPEPPQEDRPERRS